MNRRFYILTLLTLASCLLIFTLYPSFKISRSLIPYQNATGHKKAFATMVSDPTMIEATLVSIYSLNYATKVDIIVLLADSTMFSPSHIEQLEKVGAQVIKTSFPSNNAIVNLWALFDYQKIIYFTPDVVFEKNVNHLLSQPAGSAKINDQVSILVVEPNPHSFELLVRDHGKSSLLYLLEQSSLIDYKLRLTDHSLSEIALVYNGPMKPWNFHSYHDTDWKKYYDPVSFYKWRRIRNDVDHLFHPGTEWKNKARQRTICDSYLDSNINITHFPIQDQFSVMISTYNPERIEHLSLIIRHLLKSKKVHTVFVTWHNPDLDVPASLYSEIKNDDYNRVKVLKQSFDSLNNRFNPTGELVTDAVYIMDDDIYVDLEDLEFTFTTWQSRKDSVVGHFPRIHTYDPESQLATYKLTGKAPFSIILTKSMFIRSDYLFSYTCLLEPKLHASVDNQLNCEDLGFSMMASGLSGAAPTYVRTLKTMEDFGLRKGISTNTAHMPARSQCISNFITDYWHKKDPLVKSFDAIAPFIRPQIRPGNWTRIENTIMN